MNLRPYQAEGRDFLASRKTALLADEMRLGKTPQAILAAMKVGAQRILVVCPAIATTQWVREWERWAGREAHRLTSALEAYPTSGPDVLVASYAMARTYVRELASGRWDLLIVDESHFAKNPESQRAQAVLGREGLVHAAARAWLLSGTPAPNHAGELWPMLRTFGVTKIGYEEFVRHYCVQDYTGKVRGTRESAIPELRKMLAGFMLRRKRSEVAPEMPPIGMELLYVEPSELCLRDFFLAAEVLITAAELQEQIARLEHMADRSPTPADLAAIREARLYCAAMKAEPLVDHIADAMDRMELNQTVVFGWHKLPLELVRGGLVARGVRTAIINGHTPHAERVDIMDKFQRGIIKAVVANIAAAGTAIDLSAAQHGYFLELDWVPGNNAQAASRLVSLQTKLPVTYDIVTWRGSADEKVMKSLTRKTRELSMLY